MIRAGAHRRPVERGQTKGVAVGEGVQWWIKAFPDREEGPLARLRSGEEVFPEALERCRLEEGG
ncbi:MAG: hypothetical protein IRZ00_06105 [Gemmatimonadetes bacterium]|nr:hypothetical protein [Gemmatimonadota bacterium]